MRILLACDKFKGSLTAEQVHAHLAAGLSSARPDAEVRTLPVADGGDGILDAALRSGFTRVPITVAGPTGEPVQTAYAVRSSPSPGGTVRDVVIELADACGLSRLPGGVLAPLTASTRGLGEVMAAALVAERPRTMTVGIGGSASTDGGAGMLAALGIVPRDADGEPVRPGGVGLLDVTRIDVSRMAPRLAFTLLRFASDVASPLTGPDGAARVFGPQKGATPEDVDLLERALTHWADVVSAAGRSDLRDRAGTGAAGGVGYAALAVLHADLRAGIDLVLDLVDVESALDGVDLVITGEGSVDEQTLLGKAPAGVAARARAHGIPVVAVCGRTTLAPTASAREGFETIHALTDLEPDPRTCMAHAGPLLERLAAERLLG